MSRVGALLLTGFGVAVLVASASAALPRSPIAARQSILVMPAPAKGARAKDRLDRNDDCVACIYSEQHRLCLSSRGTFYGLANKSDEDPSRN